MSAQSKNVLRPECVLRGAYLQIDLGLEESEAGTVVSVRIDVCQHHSEERGCLPVPGQLPTSRLAELRRKHNHSRSVAAGSGREDFVMQRSNVQI